MIGTEATNKGLVSERMTHKLGVMCFLLEFNAGRQFCDPLPAVNLAWRKARERYGCFTDLKS
jgi:hypothetical protein